MRTDRAWAEGGAGAAAALASPREPAAGAGARERQAPGGGVVALLLRDFAGGGAERALINLANGLAELGVAADLVVLNDAGPFRRYVGPGVRVVALQSVQKGPLTGLAAAKLVTYLRHRKPARLISTLEALTLAAFVAHLLVGRRRDLVIRVATTFDREPRPWLRRLLVPLVYRWHPGVFVANSAASAANLRQHVPLDAERLHVIYNAVDFEATQRLSTGEPEHGVPFGGEGRFILFAGRLTPAKRLDNLLRAFACLDAPDVKLVILGEGPLRQQLLQLIDELGLQERVWLPGFTVNPYAYMSRAAAFVLTSDYEGLPTVLIEALACGCPVVSTDCVSGPREVLEGGRWGELVPVGDVGALAAAIRQTLASPLPADVLRERARRFSVQAAAESYYRLCFPSPGA